MKQTEIPSSQLNEGLASETNAFVPAVAIALLRPSSDELQQQLGIEFQDSFDNLDYLRLALFETDHLGPVALIDHLRSPQPGTAVCVQESSEPVDLSDLLRFVAALGLADDDVIWIRRRDPDPPSHAHR